MSEKPDHHHNHHSVIHHHHTKDKLHQPVESILVCTGVYNPQNDLLFHVRKLFEHKESIKMAQKSRKTIECDDNSGGDSSSVSSSEEYEDDDECLIERPREQSEELDEAELARALSSKNSFISYFEDKLNIPDHTFDNLKHSVDYILKANNLRV